MKDKRKKAREILFDEGKSEPLVLLGGSGRELSFEQVYATERGEEILCILRPIAKVDGLRPQDAIVFSLDEEGNFRAVKDQSLAEGVFAEFYEELGGMSGGGTK